MGGWIWEQGGRVSRGGGRLGVASSRWIWRTAGWHRIRRGYRRTERPFALVRWTRVGRVAYSAGGCGGARRPLAVPQTCGAAQKPSPRPAIRIEARNGRDSAGRGSVRSTRARPEGIAHRTGEDETGRWRTPLRGNALTMFRNGVSVRHFARALSGGGQTMKGAMKGRP